MNRRRLKNWNERGGLIKKRVKQRSETTHINRSLLKKKKLIA